MWSELMRGKEQLELYREMVRQEAVNLGKAASDWTGDPTTDSYAYAYRNREDGKVDVITQGRAPNGDVLAGFSTIDPEPLLAPDNMLANGIIDNFTLRRDFGGGLFKAINTSAADFVNINQLVDSKCVQQIPKALDSGFPQMLSMKITPPPIPA